MSLGYRKSSRGAGAWVAKIVVDGNRIEAKIGIADDDGAPFGALTFRAAVTGALDWAQRQHAALEDNRDKPKASSTPTVKSAVEDYAAARRKRSDRNGRNAGGRLRKHVLADDEFASMTLPKLRAADVEAWRGRLVPMAPATENRLLNDVRAALNAAAEKHRRSLPAYLAAEIKVGTRANSVADEARKQLLTDDQIRAAVAAAMEVDEDFGHLVLLAATTGARHSQLQRLSVGDLQAENLRVMMPSSRKGRSVRAKPKVAVPLPADAVVKLKSYSSGRAVDEPLLVRWHFRRLAGRLKWEKDRKGPWGAAYELNGHWSAVVAKAQLPPGTVPYALRHSSIVRGLRNGLPVRLVAALHDTSSEMIEKHYAAFIADATEELSRRAVLVL
ncbi:tyrosine-type recombinase/integrase [Mesorhizobium marinum]|uniref:tyrosine-type recombinase/integrase n=1 Tax=Mesorhizobium marinum TaxID=3228790 RepID=UPI003465BD61